MTSRKLLEGEFSDELHDAASTAEPVATNFAKPAGGNAITDDVFLVRLGVITRPRIVELHVIEEVHRLRLNLKVRVFGGPELLVDRKIDVVETRSVELVSSCAKGRHVLLSVRQDRIHRRGKSRRVPVARDASLGLVLRTRPVEMRAGHLWRVARPSVAGREPGPREVSWRVGNAADGALARDVRPNAAGGDPDRIEFPAPDELVCGLVHIVGPVSALAEWQAELA